MAKMHAAANISVNEFIDFPYVDLVDTSLSIPENAEWNLVVLPAGCLPIGRAVA